MLELEAQTLYAVLIRLAMAALMGGVIGLEREKARRSAGLRTHMLICLGAALIMCTGEYIFERYGGENNIDPARMGAQVVSGIGFLGAGSIVVSGKSRIRGLTTAAGLWTSACIGLVMGIGFFECGIAATAAMYIIIGYFKKVEDRITFYDGWFTIYVSVEDASSLANLYDGIKELGMKTGEVQILGKKHECKEALVSVRNDAHKERGEILSALDSIGGVVAVRYIS